MQSNRLPASTRLSSSAGSLLLSRKGVTYRDTRESTEGLDISWRSALRRCCCCLVSGSIYSTRTHDLRNSRTSPMALSLSCPFSFSYTFSLSRSPPSVPCLPPSLARVPISTLFTPPIFLPLVPTMRISPASRIYGARNSDDVHSSSRVTSGNSADSLSLPCTHPFLPLPARLPPTFFFGQRWKESEGRSREARATLARGRFGKTRLRKGAAVAPIISRFCISRPYVKYTAHGNLVLSPPLNSSRLSALEFLSSRYFAILHTNYKQTRAAPPLYVVSRLPEFLSRTRRPVVSLGYFAASRAAAEYTYFRHSSCLETWFGISLCRSANTRLIMSERRRCFGAISKSCCSSRACICCFFN